MKQFEDFDVGNGGADEFEDFDVMAEPETAPESEATIESLGGLSQSEDQLQALLAARDELEQMLMPDVAMQALDADGEEVFGYGNIVGVGIGEQEVGGRPTGQLALKVLVKEKVRASQIASEALVPQSVGGVITDVEETGEIYPQMFTARRRPAPGGVSIGNCRIVHAGTLGCLVFRGNQLFILSNNHVMALSNASPLGTGIPQPGRLDPGVLCPRDIIARLTQFVPISFAPGANNMVDAAIARTSPNLVDRRMLRPGGVLERLRAPHVNPALNMRVQKSGRTTQYTRGYIDLINTTVSVPFPGGAARFVRQFRVRGIRTRFGDRGDSGSLVTTFPSNQPVGLLFAGNTSANIIFCNPIAAVLGALNVNIVY